MELGLYYIDLNKNLGEDFSEYESGSQSIPHVNASASRNSKGEINISLLNTHPENEVKLNIGLPETRLDNISGKILTSSLINDYNTFENPNKVKPESFDKFIKDGDSLLIKLPEKSLVVLNIS